MANASAMLPEELLIATLNKVGEPVRLKDEGFAEILNQTAQAHAQSAFAAFRWHPVYQYSPTLADALQNLDHAGSLVRENANQTYFRASAHTLGEYGRQQYDSLDPDQKKLVDEVADAVRRKFGAA